MNNTITHVENTELAFSVLGASFNGLYMYTMIMGFGGPPAFGFALLSIAFSFFVYVGGLFI